jgi:hypothetical protein
MGGEPSLDPLMTEVCWWLVDRASRMLAADERDAVRGDFAESGQTAGQALRDVLGLVVRRQAALWRRWPPSLVLVGVVAPLAMLLSIVSRRVAGSTAVYAWMYFNNWDWAYLGHRAFWIILAQAISPVLLHNLALICSSWIIGSVIGTLSSRTLPVNGSLFCFALLFGELVAPWYERLQQKAFLDMLDQRVVLRHLHDEDAVFSLTFYRVVLPLLVQIVLVLLPSLWGMYKGLGMVTIPWMLRGILCAPTIVVMAVLAAYQGVWWAALATRDTTWLLRSWQVPPLSFAIAGPVMFWCLIATRRRWRQTAATPPSAFE